MLHNNKSGQLDQSMTPGVRTEELDVVLHGLPVESVQHGVARPVGRAGAPVRLAALTEVQ